MRQTVFVLGVVGLGFVFVMSPIGCTTLLGSFDVASGSSDAAPGVGGDSGGGDANACTMCGTQCVDLTSNTLNCGACGVACLGGQTCQSSACACPTGQAFCGGQCVRADRQHCGASCSACATDEICGATSCTAGPAPAFAATPRDPTGWIDAAGAPISFKLQPTGAPGTIYECRTGPDADFTPTVPVWKACDGAMGMNPTHTPTADMTKPEGTYRTEYRYRSDTFKSDAVSFLFYVHHSLDHVPSCPRSGHTEDGPHFSDDAYFKAAQDYSILNGGFPFALADVFPMLGARATDPFVLRGASIRIPFQGVKLVDPANVAPFPDSDWGAHGVNTPFDPSPIVVKTLHHKYVLNPTRTLMLVRRQYMNPIKNDCKNQMKFGSGKAKLAGPAGLGRGPHYLDCEAFVLDVHGQALCMGPNPAGTAPIPLEIDRHVDIGTGGPPLCTLTAGIGSPTFTVSGGTCFSSSYIGYNIEIPNSSGCWYNITAVSGSTQITVSSAIPSPSRPNCNVAFPGFTNVHYRVGNGKVTAPTISTAIPSGFAQLLKASHKVNVSNPPYNEATKCETLGCADGKPWMTFLPP